MKIKFICGAIEDGRAVLRAEDGSEVIWPVSLLPPGTMAGSKLETFISENGVGNKTLAKDILNEILDLGEA